MTELNAQRVVELFSLNGSRVTLLMGRQQNKLKS